MDVGVKAPQRQATVAQLLCLVLLTLIFLGIAATIVLSLISVYVPTRDSPPAARVTSGPQQASIPLSSDAGLTAGSSLDATNLNSLQSQMQNAMTSDPSVSHAATVNVQSATVGGSSKRKRRQATTSSAVLIVIYELVYSHVCVSRRCRLFTLGRSHIMFPSLSISLPSITDGNTVTSDIETISEYWANYRPYKDNPANYFGVTDTGLPAGCQVEQVHVMHRHATRYPTHSDLVGIEEFHKKIEPFLGSFTGPLSFLNTWSLRLGNDTLVPQGRAEEYTSGTQFWGKYGRLLYNAPAGQATYNDTNQDKPFLRCNTVQRIVDSVSMWAEGFFGPYNATSKYTLTRMDVTSRNNTLASYNGCPRFAPGGQHPNFFNFSSNYYGTFPLFLTTAVTRLSAYGPSGVDFNVNDTYQMQNLCVFEYGALGSSDFCSLFTLNEWKGFDYIWDLALYNGYSFGNPAGRALGLGYLQELIARLKGELISVSESTVNSTLTSDAALFPLNRPFYLDMTHDFTIVNLIAAASIDYFRKKLTFTSFPPPTRTFRVARITPYAARFITEKIGCVSQNPTATNANATQYSTTQYQYSKSAATHKFIRMRLNSAIVPISTIRGGFCAGRTDGMCPLDNFLASQANASAAANFQAVCYSNFTYDASKFGEDGNYFP